MMNKNFCKLATLFIFTTSCGVKSTLPEDKNEQPQISLTDHSLYTYCGKNFEQNKSQSFDKFVELIEAADCKDLVEKSLQTESLDISKLGLNDIEFVGNLNHLVSINISGNNIEDLSPLQSLGELKYLYASDNLISLVDPLKRLKKIELIDLSKNQIQNISALPIINLKQVYLDENLIDNVNVFENAESLQILTLNYNKVWNLPKFSKTLNYLSLLKIADKNETSELSLEMLSNLKNLKYLNISGNKVSNLSLVSELTGMESLYIDNMSISDLSFISSLNHLTRLSMRDVDFPNNQALIEISNLVSDQFSFIDIANTFQAKSTCDSLREGFIQDACYLEVVEVVSCDAPVNDEEIKQCNRALLDESDMFSYCEKNSSDMSLQKFMKYMNFVGCEDLAIETKNIKSLNLSNIGLNDGEFLKYIPSLHSLNFSGNNIKDISFLESMKDLEFLYAGNNLIEDVKFVLGLVKLKLLDLSYNKLESAESLPIQELEALYLDGNNLNNLDVVSTMSKLKTLSLSYTKIQKFKNFESKLKYLNIEGLSFGDERLDLSFLENQDELKILNISATRILNKEKISLASNLESLFLDESKVWVYDFIENLEKLNRLSVEGIQVRGNNAIASIDLYAPDSLKILNLDRTNPKKDECEVMKNEVVKSACFKVAVDL